MSFYLTADSPNKPVKNKIQKNYNLKQNCWTNLSPCSLKGTELNEAYAGKYKAKDKKS